MRHYILTVVAIASLNVTAANPGLELQKAVAALETFNSIALKCDLDLAMEGYEAIATNNCRQYMKLVSTEYIREIAGHCVGALAGVEAKAKQSASRAQSMELDSKREEILLHCAPENISKHYTYINGTMLKMRAMHKAQELLSE